MVISSVTGIRKPDRREGRSGLLLLFFDLLKAVARAENERDAPDARKSHKGVDNAAQKRGLTAADPRHDVKLE